MGTIANALAIILGSVLGIIIGSRFSDKYQSALINSFGLVILALSIKMSMASDDFLLSVGVLSLGVLVGEYFNLEGKLERVGVNIKQRFAREDGGFVQGFVISSMLYCTGSLAILGAIKDGLTGDATLLYTKSLMDGVISIALAATYGFGVAFSALSVFVYQGIITLIAKFTGDSLSQEFLNQITSTGGIILMGLGLNMLKVVQIRVFNMTPALLFLLLYFLIVK